MSFFNEVLEVISSHLKKSFNLKIHVLSDSAVNICFLTPDHSGWCNYFCCLLSFQLNLSLQLTIVLKTRCSVREKADIFSYIKHLSRSLWTIAAYYTENDQFLYSAHSQ